MYADLYGDIKHKNELGYTLSDSYDLVQEGALYLFEHYGKHLSDVVGYSKTGKPITIEIACICKMMKVINRKTSDYYRMVSLEALTPASEPSYEIKEEVAQDYTLYEKIVSSLLTMYKSVVCRKKQPQNANRHIVFYVCKNKSCDYCPKRAKQALSQRSFYA